MNWGRLLAPISYATYTNLEIFDRVQERNNFWLRIVLLADFVYLITLSALVFQRILVVTQPAKVGVPALYWPRAFCRNVAFADRVLLILRCSRSIRV